MDCAEVRRGRAGGVCAGNDGVLSGKGGGAVLFIVDEVPLLVIDVEVSLRGSGGGAFVLAGLRGIA